MHIRDATPRDIIRLALAALPDSNEGLAIVAVDVRNGNVEVLLRNKNFENFDWSVFTDKKAIFHFWKNERSHVDTLVKRYRHEICGNILELKEEHPHLFE